MTDLTEAMFNEALRKATIREDGIEIFSKRVFAEAILALATQHPSQFPGETLADRLDAMADAQPSGSQASSDLYAAATIWRKHLQGPRHPSQSAGVVLQGDRDDPPDVSLIADPVLREVVTAYGNGPHYEGLQRVAALLRQGQSAGEPVAVLRWERGTPGRENEMPRVVSCNKLPDGEYPVYTAPPMGAFRLLVAACNRLDFESEEYDFPDGWGCGAGMDYWSEFRTALERAQEALTDVVVAKAWDRFEAAMGASPPPTDAARASDLPPLTCRHSNRSDCALYEPAARPSREWYAKKIRETEGLDDNLPRGALATPAGPDAARVEADRRDAVLGRVALRFVDRAGDPVSGIDDAGTILREFHEAMTAALAAERKEQA